MTERPGEDGADVDDADSDRARTPTEKPDAATADVPAEIPEELTTELQGLPIRTDEPTEPLPIPPETTDEPRSEIEESVLADVETFFARLREELPEPPEPTAARRWLEKSGLANKPRAETFPDEEFVRNEWFAFDYLPEYEEVERYWVNKPYCFVTILYDADAKTYRYRVVEPLLNEFESYVRDDLTRVIRNSLMYQELESEADRERIFAERVEEIIDEHAATVNPGTVQKLFYYFMRDFIGYGRIDAMMRDSSLEDISCNGAGTPTFVYHRAYRDLRTNVSFDAKRLNSLVVRLAQRSGKHISISNPLIDASLPDGSRIQLTLGTAVSSRGANFTIRKFADVPYTPIDLIGWNTFSVEEMAYLWLAIENNMSLIFAGGTGSGKTTSMNAVSFFIPPDSKVVSIEDTREITLPHDNWIQSVTRQGLGSEDEGEVTTYQLLQAALRQRPEYLLVGEIRTEQRVALTFFQAIGTGHTAYTTIHADSLEAALARLENPPLSVPAQMIQNLDIISIQRQVHHDGRRVRRNDRIGEVTAEKDHGGVDTKTVFERDPATDAHERVGESRVLDRIASQRGWSDAELQTALDEREQILSYLHEEEITDYADVATVIQTYARDPETVVDAVESGTLDPASLRRGDE